MKVKTPILDTIVGLAIAIPFILVLGMWVAMAVEQENYNARMCRLDGGKVEWVITFATCDFSGRIR